MVFHLVCFPFRFWYQDTSLIEPIFLQGHRFPLHSKHHCHETSGSFLGSLCSKTLVCSQLSSTVRFWLARPCCYGLRLCIWLQAHWGMQRHCLSIILTHNSEITCRVLLTVIEASLLRDSSSFRSAFGPHQRNATPSPGKLPCFFSTDQG